MIYKNRLLQGLARLPTRPLTLCLRAYGASRSVEGSRHRASSSRRLQRRQLGQGTSCRQQASASAQERWENEPLQ